MFKNILKKLVSKEEKIRGCIMGGAIGDALGYPIEFSTYDEILKYWRSPGIKKYTESVGEFSDDTQMTLFTIDGLITNKNYDIKNIYKSYLDWYATQTYRYCVRDNYAGYDEKSILLNTEGLYKLMAPGNTCLSAIGSGEMGTIESPLNNSKGCGGVMRVAPVGIFFEDSMEAAKNAAEIAAITHGHPLGYLSAAVFSCMINLIIHQDFSIRNAVFESIKIVDSLYPDIDEFKDFKKRLKNAVTLALGKVPDIACIEMLGQGWVGDEALAIAVFCCLRHSDSSIQAIISAVNHSGDSDSTGAIAGNIMGAFCGYNSFPNWYITNLRMNDLVKDMSQKLILNSSI